MDALLTDLQDRVLTAAAARQALCIRGGGSKDFYGNTPQGQRLDVSGWSGIQVYDPSELVITARAGTSLALIEATLAERGQMLAFEPPHFSDSATIGGCIAAGLAGPRRASAGYTAGGVRDFVLGAQLLDGRARLLRFGGTVIKNVAGYDVSRLLAGSLGILGVILEVSVKVLPVARSQRTCMLQVDQAQALHQCNVWAGQPLPLSATAWLDGWLYVRWAGAEPAVQAAVAHCGGELLSADVANSFWADVREQRLAFFDGDAPLWRLSLPSTAAPLMRDVPQLIEWGGAQRWLRSTLPAAAIRVHAAQSGGHATLFRGGDRNAGVFTPLSAAQLAIHHRLKAEFDPAGIFNPSRLIDGL
jgi:glycolate oxidase FAD binding subunit